MGITERRTSKSAAAEQNLPAKSMHLLVLVSRTCFQLMDASPASSSCKPDREEPDYFFILFCNCALIIGRERKRRKDTSRNAMKPLALLQRRRVVCTMSAAESEFNKRIRIHFEELGI